MYERFFELERNPFQMTADPHFLFLTPEHREALAGLAFTMLNRKGLVALIGEAGTGKTTLLKTALDEVPRTTAEVSVIDNPGLTPPELLESVLLGFGIGDIPAAKPHRLVRLRQYLLEVAASGRSAVLVIDEAHTLSSALLEEVRLLTNIETPGGKLLQIVLAAQPELEERLDAYELRQFKQRIAHRFLIKPLSPSEVDGYVRHRWHKAGGKHEAPFTEDALDYLVLYSGGIPRVINVLSDNALMLAFSESRAAVWPEDIVIAGKELTLLGARNGRCAFTPRTSASSDGSLEKDLGVALERPGLAVR
jgi:general secretion pathway protein A